MKYFISILLFISLSTSIVQAKRFTYWQVHKMPKSVEKDYYIWRFLSQKTTTKREAKKIIKEANNLNSKLKKAYRRKTGYTPRMVKTEASLLKKRKWLAKVKIGKQFRYGLSLLKQHKRTKAIRYLQAALKGYTKQYDKDKVNFWLYLATKNNKYMKRLRDSCDINIYTLISADKVNGRYPKSITRSISKRRKYGFDIENPIDWAKVKAKMNSGSFNLDSLAWAHKSQETIGIYTYIKAKACNDKDAYFPMPYRRVMKKLSIRRQALIYAIARQESRFVPASVSRSFALGMMQFMPFLIKHISKQKGKYMDLDMMFNPYTAIEYADYHLDYLTKYLYHPLFIAYAYNGGIGFTRRHIRNRRNFRRGSYEPYMSMEMMKNDEAREYGKKVLANYVIYLNKLGVSTRLSHLLKTLTTPSKTDRFRR